MCTTVYDGDMQYEYVKPRKEVYDHMSMPNEYIKDIIEPMHDVVVGDVTDILDDITHVVDAGIVYAWRKGSKSTIVLPVHVPTVV